MKRILLVAITAAFVSPAVAQAASTIFAGFHILQIETAGQVIPIVVSGDDMVQGANLILQVGDGSGIGPRITNVDVVGPGTIFAANNTGNSPVIPAPGHQVWGGTTTASGTVLNNGILAFVTIDTRGSAFGIFDLLLGIPEFEVSTDWAGSLGVPEPFLVHGTLFLDPEPSSIVLASFAGCGLLLYARRRRARLSKSAAL